MPAPRKYPDELRGRAVRMFFEIRRQTGGAPGTIVRVTDQLGVHREAPRGWVCQAEINDGQRPGTSTSDAQKIAKLEREVCELRRASRPCGGRTSRRTACARCGGNSTGRACAWHGARWPD
ncbi:hypothetical protein GCM10018953_18110 [Streptosporangium nondiastaticum]